MKKNIIAITAIIVTLMLLFAVPVLAGDNNQNDDNGYSAERGTGAPHGPSSVDDEGLGGCRAGGGDYLVDNPTPFGDPYWVGGPCCPSNEIATDSGYPELNQCCNPPEDVRPPQPGNHCECFELRES